MNKTLTILVLLFCLLLPDFSFAQDQTARIYGRVFMPVVKKQKRSFRGRLYRNRLSSRKKRQKNAAVLRTSFQDVIVAAYPLSFKGKTQPLEKARILQKNAEFRPHVLAVTPGTRVEFINLDRFFHNVFSYSPGAKFNIGRRPTNTTVWKTIYKTGKINLFCDIHSQMNATIVSLDTPYFTQPGKSGVYLLKDLPPGKYRLEIIHPDFPKTKTEITVRENDKLEQSFTLSK
jgi:plastocyanin